MLPDEGSTRTTSARGGGSLYCSVLASAPLLPHALALKARIARAVRARFTNLIRCRPPGTAPSSRARPFRYPSDNAPAKPATDSAFSQDRCFRFGWSAAHPAEELLQLDAVEASDDLVVADPKHRNPVAVELLPFAHRTGIVVDRPEVEFDAKLVQKLDHGGRLDGVVGAVEDCFCVTHLCNQPEPSSITAIEPINCFDELHRRT